LALKAISSVWPEYDEEKTHETTIQMAVQIMGKMRGTIQLSKDADQKTAVETALKDPKIGKLLEGKTIIKEIYGPGRILNLIAR